MRKIVASMLMTMDGVVENPQRWLFQFRSEGSQKYKFDELFASDALLLGRITYQELAAAWPGATDAVNVLIRWRSFLIIIWHIFLPGFSMGKSLDRPAKHFFSQKKEREMLDYAK